MLTLKVPGTEFYDPQTNQFHKTKSTSLLLEHSLLSVSKWEEKHCKPFLGKEPRTLDESIDYVRCMTVTQNVDPLVYASLTNENIEVVNQYIDAPMTATQFSDDGSSKFNHEVITSEIIYYWMITLNIPFECQKWHLNKLLTLIRVCNVKNAPKNKQQKRGLSQQELAARRALNKKNRERFGSKG